MLAGGVAINVGMLLGYQYLTFLLTQVDALATALGLHTVPIINVALPLGISFFTFQGISYLIDIHRGAVTTQRSLLKFAMYKSMFPQLVAGPIERYAQVARRINVRPISAWRVRTGMLMFFFGLAQKVVIADTVAVTADAIFKPPTVELMVTKAIAPAPRIGHEDRRPDSGRLRGPVLRTAPASPWRRSRRPRKRQPRGQSSCHRPSRRAWPVRLPSLSSR